MEQAFSLGRSWNVEFLPWPPGHSGVLRSLGQHCLTGSMDLGHSFNKGSGLNHAFLLVVSPELMNAVVIVIINAIVILVPPGGLQPGP